MNATERRELRRIVDNRMQLVEEEIALAANAAREEAKNRIAEEYLTQRLSLERQIASLMAKVEKLVDQAHETTVTAAENGWGFTHRVYSQRSGDPIQVTMHNDWYNSEQTQRTVKAADVISVAQNEALIELRKIKNQLHEDIALDALTSEDARMFLESIPQAGDVFSFADPAALAL